MQMCPQYASNLADGNNNVQYKANLKRKKIIERKYVRKLYIWAQKRQIKI